MEFEFLVNQEPRRILLEKKDGRFVFRLGEASFEADVQFVSPNIVSFLLEGRSHLIYIAEDRNKIYISLDGEIHVLQRPGAEEKKFERGEDKTQKGKSVIRAPMPGKVIKVCVAESDAVRKNQTLAIVEAMKMENELKAPIEGVVKKIYAAAGDLVDSEKPLLEIEPKA
jgi:biotin carboxyl carrier protein